MPLKTCSKCDEPKPIGAFYTSRGRRYPHCKPCHHKMVRQSRARRPELYRQLNAKAQKKYEETAKGSAARGRSRARTNVKRREARLINPEPIRLADRRRQADRRARERAAMVEHVDPNVVFERDEGMCGICGHVVDPGDWHLDHVIPLACGGEHSYANVQVSHPRCNLSKGAKAA